jgi:peptidoglycan-associated lipoprotein
MKKLTVILASLMVAACASSQKTSTSQAPQSSEMNASTVASAAANSAAQTELDRLNAEIQQLQKRSDYFDYKKYVIKPQYESVIQKEAEFIKSHKNDFITLEGNADERGSDGYNLALGEKRAEAVQKSLLKYGVPAGQIKLVSLGKEKPRLTCHEEKCWKENRRVDFVHKLG